MRILILLLISFSAISQSTSYKLSMELSKKMKLESTMDSMELLIGSLKLNKVREDIKAIGLPSNNYIEHSGMILEYAEEHEQAAWVAHIILPDITDGVVFRTNDFRADPKVKTGTAIETDYFLTRTKADGTKEHDGFGYDRGHLAPSADFRWNAKALSESYFYSNMSPQLPEFNRKIWAELESTLRGYVMTNNVPLYIVTLPILNDDLPKIKEAMNHVSIPEFYLKVALDIENNRGVAFVIPNSKIHNLLPSYAITINKVEELTGYDFFNKYENEEVERTLNKEAWFPELGFEEKEPISMSNLIPKKYFNTVAAYDFMGNGKEYTVCGNVVSSRYSKKGHLWLNLDKQFPNHIFSIFIRKNDLVNFSGDVEAIVKNKNVCFESKIEDYSNVPTMNIENEKQVKLLDLENN